MAFIAASGPRLKSVQFERTYVPKLAPFPFIMNGNWSEVTEVIAEHQPFAVGTPT
jgi:hypothetical protein